MNINGFELTINDLKAVIEEIKPLTEGGIYDKELKEILKKVESKV